MQCHDNLDLYFHRLPQQALHRCYRHHQATPQCTWLWLPVQLTVHAAIPTPPATTPFPAEERLFFELCYGVALGCSAGGLCSSVQCQAHALCCLCSRVYLALQPPPMVVHLPLMQVEWKKPLVPPEQGAVQRVLCLTWLGQYRLHLEPQFLAYVRDL